MDTYIEQIKENFVFDYVYKNVGKEYVWVKKDNWCGILDYNGKLLKKIYCDDFHVCRRFYIVDVSNKKFIIDSENNEVKSFPYEEVSLYNSKYFITKLNGKWGVVDYSGEVVLDFIYDELFPTYHNGMFVVSKDKKIGLMTLEKDFIIPLEYEDYGEVRENNFILTKNGKMGIVNDLNEIIIPFDYRYLSFISDTTLVAQKKKNKYIIINLQNEQVSETEFKIIFIWGFGKDSKLFPAMVNDLYGFIDEFGNLKIDYKYKDFNNSWNQYILAVNLEGEDDTWGYIDEYENIIVPFEYNKPDLDDTNYEDFIILRKDTGVGIVNKDGKIKVDFIFDDIKTCDYEAKSKYLCARYEGKFGIIDEDGNVLRIDKKSLDIEPIFIYPNNLSEQIKKVFDGNFVKE